MSGATAYELWLTSDTGERLAILERAVSFTYTHSTGGLGFFSVTLPGTFPRTFLDTTRRVMFFRKPSGGAMALDFVGFIRRVVASTDANNQLTRTISGYGPNWLLDGRIVYASAGSPGAEKTGAADDVMKAIVREQMGASAAAARALLSTYFSVQADSSMGPTITKGFAYRPVLDVLQELTQVARQAGVETFWEIRPLDTTRFQFVTSTAQLGRDLRGSGMVFGDEFGNLRTASLSEDWSDERNFGYGLGSGEGASRVIQTAEDTTRSGRSWYARREIAKDARNQTGTAGVTAAAQAAITAGRPVTAFSGDIVSTAGAAYGVNWRNGDRVDVTFDGRQFDALIRAVTVSVGDDGREQISARLEAYL